MKVGILGTGDVGQALGRGFASLGHSVKLGGRDAKNEKAVAWAKSVGDKASTGTFADVAEFGELIVLATLGSANESAIKSAGLEKFRNKLVMDATNPLDYSKGMPPGLAVGHTDSGGEQVQRLLPDARVVKAFNTVGNALFFRPELPGGPPDMFIAGNDEGAKAQAREILGQFGWGVIDVGGIQASRYLEAMCMVWVAHGFKTNTWTHAFKLLHR